MAGGHAGPAAAHPFPPKQPQRAGNPSAWNWHAPFPTHNNSAHLPHVPRLGQLALRHGEEEHGARSEAAHQVHDLLLHPCKMVEQGDGHDGDKGPHEGPEQFVDIWDGERRVQAACRGGNVRVNKGTAVAVLDPTSSDLAAADAIHQARTRIPGFNSNNISPRGGGWSAGHQLAMSRPNLLANLEACMAAP